MRLCEKGESFGKSLQRAVTKMQNVECSDVVKGNGEIFACDRGYQGQNLLKFLTKAGFEIVGTIKRGPSFLFTFGNVSSSTATTM